MKFSIKFFMITLISVLFLFNGMILAGNEDYGYYEIPQYRKKSHPFQVINIDSTVKKWYNFIAINVCLTIIMVLIDTKGG